MKNLFLLAALSAAIISCSGSKKQSNASSEAQTRAASELAVFALDDLLPAAAENLEDTLTVVGYVTHTCKHAGKRCFIVGESQKASIRVEAKGDIGGFNRELVGSKLAITGILKEHRVSEEYISAMEKDVNQRAAEDGSAETCDAELRNISDMRQWMKDNNKNYYVIYFIEGLSYEELD